MSDGNKPNVILIGIDTLRADHLGAYGYNRETSPTIDSLAKNGVLFENCFSQAPITAPSFMSIMTSRYPTYHGVIDNVCAQAKGRAYALDPSVPTLAETLKRNGYTTAAFTDGGHLINKLGFSNGFDYYSMNSRKATTGHWGQGIIPKKDIFYWLGERKKENFFMFFHTYAVHNPWFAESKYWNIFNTTYSGGLLIAPDFPPFINWFSENKSSSTYEYFIEQIDVGSSEDLNYWMAAYDGAISYVDNFISELISYLSALDILDNTMIIITSDHGEEFLDHSLVGHKQLYNELLHVPLIFYYKNHVAPRRIEQRVRSIDIFPTIMDLLKIGIDFPIQGKSLISTSHNTALELPTIADVEVYGQAIQYGNYKYIYPRYRKRRDRIDELYDLNKDPLEKNNIALQNLIKVKEMAEKLEWELNTGNLPKPKKNILYLGLKTNENKPYPDPKAGEGFTNPTIGV